MQRDKAKTSYLSW